MASLRDLSFHCPLFSFPTLLCVCLFLLIILPAYLGSHWLLGNVTVMWQECMKVNCEQSNAVGEIRGWRCCDIVLLFAPRGLVRLGRWSLRANQLRGAQGPGQAGGSRFGLRRGTSMGSVGGEESSILWKQDLPERVGFCLIGGVRKGIWWRESSYWGVPKVRKNRRGRARPMSNPGLGKKTEF